MKMPAAGPASFYLRLLYGNGKILVHPSKKTWQTEHRATSPTKQAVKVEIRATSRCSATRWVRATAVISKQGMAMLHAGAAGTAVAVMETAAATADQMFLSRIVILAEIFPFSEKALSSKEGAAAKGRLLRDAP